MEAILYGTVNLICIRLENAKLQSRNTLVAHCRIKLSSYFKNVGFFSLPIEILKCCLVLRKS